MPTISFALIIFLLVGIIQFNPIKATIRTEIPMYLISTRENLTYEGIEGHGYGNYSFLNINELSESCPPEVVIIVHGWDVNETEAKERFDRVKMSLEKNNYSSPLVGFSWNSDAEWHAAKSIAKWNGPRLADFVFDLIESCKQHNKDLKIRIVGHSIGSRVILSSLDSLHKNATWNNSTNNFKITSVHLLGAAVDDEEISKNPQDILDDLTNWGTLKSDYGSAIEEEVVDFYNLFNPKDNIFEPMLIPAFQIYPSFEGDLALGYNGSQIYPQKISLPINYNQTNVQSQIINNTDADGDTVCDLRTPITKICTIIGVGDNHGGYFGFRNATNNMLINDGAMNIVIQDLQKIP
ncbi:MAG: alpha/beta hydrolase [Thermoproteota archaeon]|nr:alpha/beta hydrolase [Thermoproteota archaeon]